MKLPKFGCFVDKHKPVRNRVRVDAGYTGYCKYCGAPIRRVEHGLWRRDDRTEHDKHDKKVPAEPPIDS